MDDRHGHQQMYMNRSSASNRVPYGCIKKNVGPRFRHRVDPSTSTHSKPRDLSCLGLSSVHQGKLICAPGEALSRGDRHHLLGVRTWALASMAPATPAPSCHSRHHPAGTFHDTPWPINRAWPRALHHPPRLPPQPSARAVYAPQALPSTHRVSAAWKALPHPDRLANSQSRMRQGKTCGDLGLSKGVKSQLSHLECSVTFAL